MIRTSSPFAADQIQPASLDLRLGARAYRVRASFLPGRAVRCGTGSTSSACTTIDLDPGAVLETGCVYIAELQESVRLPRDLSAAANPKSSTGRIDVFTRVIVDRAQEFDAVDAGYRRAALRRDLAAHLPGARPHGHAAVPAPAAARARSASTDAELHRAARARAHRHLGRALDPGRRRRQRRSCGLRAGSIGYRAKRHTGLVDVDRPGAYRAADYWEPLYADGRRTLILDPGQFYILASKEAVHVPPDYAAEMVPFDPLVGEFRVHYAGFFDPGFGHAAAGGEGARAVLEVRSRDVPFILEDGQIVGRLVYERMAERPEVLYGAGAGSNYQAQGLKLSKHFR